MWNKTIIAVSVAIALFTTPIIYMHGSSLKGSDDAATEMIQELDPSYEPWFSSIWTPSDNLETAFFLLQAAIGSGFIGYYLGRKRRAKKRNSSQGQ